MIRFLCSYIGKKFNNNNATFSKIKVLQLLRTENIVYSRYNADKKSNKKKKRRSDFHNEANIPLMVVKK